MKFLVRIICFTTHLQFSIHLYKFYIVVITVISYVSEMEGSRLHIPLPHVTKGPYKGNFWNIFIKDMNKLKSEPTADNLEAIIGKHLARIMESVGMPPIQLPNLRSVLKDNRYQALIPFIADCACGLPDLFPSGTILCLVRWSSSGSRSGASCPTCSSAPSSSTRTSRTHIVATSLEPMPPQGLSSLVDGWPGTITGQLTSTCHP